MLLELCQARSCVYFPGELVPVLNHPLGKKSSPGVQCKPPMTKLCAFFLSPVTDHKSEGIRIKLSKPSDLSFSL